MEATMEHRLSLRTPFNVNVAIYYNALGLLRGRSLDISRHGMLVATGHMVLPLHAIVDVAFPLEPGKRGEPLQRTPAMVVRLTRDGMGLMFSNEINAGPLQLSAYDQQHYPRTVDATSG